MVIIEVSQARFIQSLRDNYKLIDVIKALLANPNASEWVLLFLVLLLTLKFDLRIQNRKLFKKAQHKKGKRGRAATAMDRSTPVARPMIRFRWKG